MIGPDPSTEPTPSPGPPQTGIPEIDDALAALSTLPAGSLAEHQDRLTKAHAVLHEALNSDPPGTT